MIPIQPRFPRPVPPRLAALPAPSLGAVLLIGTLVAGLNAPVPAAAQGGQTPEPETFSEVVNVRVVNVDVFVTDASGRHIPGLSRDYFELLVDGEPMPISNFYYEVGGQARETGPPLAPSRGSREETTFVPLEEAQATAGRRNHVVILIDHPRLSAANRKRAFKALREAVDRLDPKDLIAVVGVEQSLVFYSDFLFDREAVNKILDRAARVSMRTEVNEIERRQIFGELTRGQSGGILARTSLADLQEILTRIRAYAAEEYARSLGSFRQIESVLSTLTGVPGRKVLLYVGEGIPTRPGEGMYVEWRNRFGGPEAGMRHYDFNSDYTREIGRFDLTQPMDQLATAANRAGVTLYAVDAEGNHGGEVRSALTEQGATSETVSVVDENFREPLEYTSRATGGRLLQSSGELPEQLGELFDDFDNFYSLGFSVPADWEPGSEHRIEVKLRGNRRLMLRHREKVRIPKPDEVEAGATVAGLMYHTLDNPLGIQASPGSPTAREDGTSVLPVRLEIPVANLELVPSGDTHAVSLSIFVSVKDKDGNPGPVQKVPFHLNIPNDKVEQAMGESAHYTLPLVVRPGDRQVAITVRDDVDRSLSTIRLDVGRGSREL
jgi:VWFA-related protein